MGTRLVGLTATQVSGGSWRGSSEPSTLLTEDGWRRDESPYIRRFGPGIGGSNERESVMASLAVAKTEAGSYRNVETKRSATPSWYRPLVLWSLWRVSNTGWGVRTRMSGSFIGDDRVLARHGRVRGGQWGASDDPDPQLAISGVVAIVVALAVGSGRSATSTGRGAA